MTESGMTSREKTLVAVLGAIIVVALIGIGVLAAKLIADKGNGGAADITPVATVASQAVTPEETATLVANPSLEGQAATPAPAAAEPVPVKKVESPAPLLPAVLIDQPLHPGRTYRIEIVAADGSPTAIRGSWSQSAKSADGKPALPLPEVIEGTTPFRLELAPPVANATSWSVSVSVAPSDLLAQPPKLAITIWDVTGK